MQVFSHICMYATTLSILCYIHIILIFKYILGAKYFVKKFVNKYYYCCPCVISSDHHSSSSSSIQNLWTFINTKLHLKTLHFLFHIFMVFICMWFLANILLLIYFFYSLQIRPLGAVGRQQKQLPKLIYYSINYPFHLSVTFFKGQTYNNILNICLPKIEQFFIRKVSDRKQL